MLRYRNTLEGEHAWYKLHRSMPDFGFLVSSPSVTPTPEQKAVWDLLLKRVGK